MREVSPGADERDWDKAKKRLAKEQYYSDWLMFFQHEIERLGWQKTLAEYMFKGDERSQDMMVRMYAGEAHDPAEPRANR